MLSDVSRGARRLLRQPGFTALAVVVLALGIGANTAVWSLLDGVVLSPLPYAEPERLVQVWATAPELGLDRVPVSFTKFRELTQGSETLAAIAAYQNESFNLTTAEDPRSFGGMRVSRGFFDVFRVEPAVGRRFLPAEDAKGGGDVVILSEGLWRRRFGADPGILGRALPLDGKTYTVVGVAPEVLRFPFGEAEIWAPRADALSFLSEEDVEAGAGYLNVVARLAPGATVESAQAEADRVSRRYAEQFPGRMDAPFRLAIVPLAEQLVGPLRAQLGLLLGAVALVLLIACVDVGNLLIAQGISRRREMAVRVALGASRGRVVRQLLGEGIALGLAGGLLGLALAWAALALLVAANPADLPRLDEVGLDGRALAFTLAVSLAAGLVSSLAPAREALSADPAGAFQDGGRAATGGPARQRAQGLLVAAEVALALVLLIGAGLLIQSFRRLSAVDLGFDPEDLLAINVALPVATYPTAAERRVFFEEVLERVRRLPGVESAALADFLPIQGAPQTPIAVAGKPVPRPEEQPLVYRLMVSPGYFRTLGARLLAGRDLDPRATPDAPLAVVINESFAERFFAGEDPLRQRLLMGDGTTEAEVVGVVADVRAQGLDTPDAPQFFLSSRQAREELSPTSFMHVLVRTSLPPASVARGVREAVAAVDREQPIADLQTMEQIVADALARRRLTTRLLALFSAAALVLCLLGIYGVVAHSVALRRKEIGLRMALGARAGQVLGEVARRGLAWVGAGVGLGLAAALLLSRLIASQLFEVSATEPLQYAVAPLLLVAAAALACWLPARRATRIDPAITLRTD